MPDVYPGDLTTRIRQLEKDVEELKALLGSREPLTVASQGWMLANMTIPAVGAGQVHIGANNNDFYARSINGIKRLMDTAGHVAPVTGAAGATYTALEQTKINQLITFSDDLVSSLVGADHMDP